MEKELMTYEEAVKIYEGLSMRCSYEHSRPPWNDATIDGDYTADELEAIAVIMRHNAKNNILEGDSVL